MHAKLVCIDSEPCHCRVEEPRIEVALGQHHNRVDPKIRPREFATEHLQSGIVRLMLERASGYLRPWHMTKSFQDGVIGHAQLKGSGQQ